MVKIASTVRTNITLPKGLPERAHAAGVNISITSAKAVLLKVKSVERETGAIAAKQTTPATTPDMQGAL